MPIIILCDCNLPDAATVLRTLGEGFEVTEQARAHTRDFAIYSVSELLTPQPQTVLSVSDIEYGRAASDAHFPVVASFVLPQMNPVAGGLPLKLVKHERILFDQALVEALACVW